MKLGQDIAQLRKQNNMTQAEVADALHISYQAVSKWERGESLPDISLLPRIAELFQISIDKLFGNAYAMKAEESVKTDGGMDESAQQGINQQITDMVNREFEIGMSEGRIPKPEELADKISEFFLSGF